MSVGCRKAFEESEPYLQSPIDDIESFYWVALWASVRNQTTVDPNTTTADEKRWQLGLRGNLTERTGVSHDMGKPETDPSSYNPVLKTMWNILGLWKDSLFKLTSEWREAVKDNSITTLHLDVFAYRGVLTFMEAIDKNYDEIRKRPGEE